MSAAEKQAIGVPIDLGHVERDDHPEKTHEIAHGLVKPVHLYQEDSNGHVLSRNLIPRPMDDPLDPLTWSTGRKHLAFASYCCFCFLSNFVASTVLPVLYPLAIYYSVDLNKAAYFSTLNILFLGLGNLFWIPLSLKIGKRPVIILSVATFFAACIWGANAKTWGSQLGARILQGLGASSAEALGPAIICDLYFLHERGSKIGFYMLMITGGGAFGGIFSGLITKSTTHWQWVFWMDSIFTGTCLILVILFLPETTFRRPVSFEEGEDETMSVAPVTTIKHRGKYSLRQSMSVTGWYDTETSLLDHYLRPLAMIRYPAVIWCAAILGLTLGWIILILTAIGDFYPTIYGFSGYAVGNVNYASLVGAVVGCPLGGLGSDWLVQAITRRRKGYFQPEFRLWALVPIFIVSPVGLFLWAGAVQNHLPAMVSIVGWAILYAALCAVPGVAFTYVADCYKPMAGEATTIIVAIKNSFAFAVSFAVVPWLEKEGYVKVMGLNFLIGGASFVAAIPLYIYGERIRKWTAQFSV